MNSGATRASVRVALRRLRGYVLRNRGYYAVWTATTLAYVAGFVAVPMLLSQSDPPLETQIKFSAATRFSNPSVGAFSLRHRQAATATMWLCIANARPVDPHAAASLRTTAQTSA